MLFNSFHFLFFFIVVTILYYSLPHKNRWFMLLMASCYFYMSFIPIYILILFFTIIIDYFAGIYLEKFTGKKRKIFLIVSLIANIGILAIFKYYNFINENITSLCSYFQFNNNIPYLSIILPIGLSFHTFQAMSYTIEVYRGNQKAERNFGIYSLYVMFYPQLVAGPIERPQNLLHQFYEKHEFDFNNISNGLKQMLFGFFMKLVVADRLSIYVDAVYNNANEHTGNSLFLATIFFSIQIYCDFAGYSQIAIGAAKVMGFNLMTNFNRPYFSKSVSEFWSRWHISLSTWFKDYLYISLGGNRLGIGRWYFNLFFVFLISGLWHGANWTYIVWGALNGLYLVSSLIFSKFFINYKIIADSKNRGLVFLNIFITYLLICFSWVYFRASNISVANSIIKKMLTQRGNVFFDSNVLYCLFAIFLLFIVELKLEYFPNSFKILSNSNSIVRLLGYLLIITIIILFGVFDGGQFIYFQF
jgi:alginate O-acetyltransferase complex protein AlgI